MDIVTELRAIAAVDCEAFEAGKICTRAADEIERLRAFIDKQPSLQYEVEEINGKFFLKTPN